MFDWLNELYGAYTRQFYTSVIPFLTFALASALFTIPLKKRMKIWFRLPIAILFYWAVFSGVAVLRTDYDSVQMRLAVRIAQYFMILPYLFAFMDESPSRVILAWSGGVAAQEFASKLLTVLFLLVGKNDMETNSFFADQNMARDLAIQYAITITVCVVLYLFFGRRDATEQDRISARSITLLSFISTVFLGVISALVREYELESLALYRLCIFLLLALAFVILFMRSGILAQSSYRREIGLMENMLTQERKQYETIKDNMDFINMKCHDIKHQLSNLEGRLTYEEIQSLQRSIEIYDQSVKTGSDTLDVVLYEKTLLAQERKISLSCLADGAALSFMGRTHLYSLFNNALGNAMEAVDKVTDPEKRVVSMTVAREDGGVSIDVSNYFSEPPAMENGQLKTTKSDKAHHGLGFRSMRYVAGLYGGTVTFEIDEDIFSLSIRFPKDAKLKKEVAA